MTQKERLGPPQAQPISNNTDNPHTTTHCRVKGCVWRGKCPVHDYASSPPRDVDYLVRQRPHTITRGGGCQVRCRRCGNWFTRGAARGHLFGCSLIGADRAS